MPRRLELYPSVFLVISTTCTYVHRIHIDYNDGYSCEVLLHWVLYFTIKSFTSKRLVQVHTHVKVSLENMITHWTFETCLGNLEQLNINFSFRHIWSNLSQISRALRWRHNGHDCISNHQPHHCLLNCLFGCRSKKTSKLRVTGLCADNSLGPVTGSCWCVQYMVSNGKAG